jgi:hypothetical protein
MLYGIFLKKNPCFFSFFVRWKITRRGNPVFWVTRFWFQICCCCLQNWRWRGRWVKYLVSSLIGWVFSFNSYAAARKPFFFFQAVKKPLDFASRKWWLFRMVLLWWSLLRRLTLDFQNLDLVWKLFSGK